MALLLYVIAKQDASNAKGRFNPRKGWRLIRYKRAVVFNPIRFVVLEDAQVCIRAVEAECVSHIFEVKVREIIVQIEAHQAIDNEKNALFIDLFKETWRHVLFNPRVMLFKTPAFPLNGCLQLLFG